jgi:hypothetical protein
MQKESSDFVKVTWFNYESVWTAVRQFAEELMLQDEVEEVIVFGSLVRRESVPGSDVDILIILRSSQLPFIDRIPLFLPRHSFPVDVDVFPYTKAEIAKMLHSGNFFVRQALREGVVIACRE